MTESVATEAKKDLRASQILTWVNIVFICLGILGYVVYWFAVPQKIAQNSATLSDHESRIRVLENDRGTLQRIDERTRAMQEDIQQIHRDFSFHFSANPSK